ncbi:MAG: 4'-phosphopantetheinyl transferase superfamily protein, partial [Paludibacteraceae bacterium]|nr:4'-phosphopantetheinyl transferase superfamily protein [Paludibacteraceae bacterium]
LEVLAERLLLKELCGESNFQHMESGKPFLDSGDMRISFSHTKNFVALIVSKECEVGIDIEYPSDRVCRVKDRFLSSVEQSTFDDDAKKILLAWCAKEALYKVLNTPMLDFARQLQIQEFEVKTEGEILAKSELQRQQIHKLNYICTKDYYLVWVETSG